MAGNIHDTLFKFTFSEVANAASMLRFLLPAALVALINFATLVRCPGSFVDEALTERHTDLLFSAKIAGRDAFVYVLFEHQSSFDPLMPFRLLVYMVRIWEAHLKAHPDAKQIPGPRALDVLLRYLFSVNERTPPHEVMALLKSEASPEVKEQIVNVAEQLIEQGRQKGLQQGLLEGRREMLLRQLTARFGTLPQAAVTRVNSAGISDLDQWIERVLTAPTLADVLETA